jgi:hypothetical protein
VTPLPLSNVQVMTMRLAGRWFVAALALTTSVGPANACRISRTYVPIDPPPPQSLPRQSWVATIKPVATHDSNPPLCTGAACSYVIEAEVVSIETPLDRDWPRADSLKAGNHILLPVDLGCDHLRGMDAGSAPQAVVLSWLQRSPEQQALRKDYYAKLAAEPYRSMPEFGIEIRLHKP